MDSSSEEGDKRELRSLGNVLQQLFEEGLINNMEYRRAVCTNLVARRFAIYQLLLTKDNKSASIVLNILRQFCAESSIQGWDADGNIRAGPSVAVVEKNPLMNETIINIVFGFLSITDLKNCRFVSQKWSAVAEPIFRKRAKVVFRDSDGILSPTTFIDTFKYTLPGVPFTAFSFSGTWSISELSNFFTTFGKNVSELEFHRIIFEEYQDLDYEDNLKYDVDISSWISKSKLKKLHITDCFTKIIVPWEQLSSVLDVSINYGVIKVNNIPSEIDKPKITPRNIFLHGVDFYCDRVKLQSVCIDDIVNFSKANNITLKQDENNTVLTLDLSISSVNAKSVKLYSITVLNWGISKWNVEKLSISQIPLPEKPNMNIKDMRFKGTSIDLFVLPPTIERLSIKEVLGAEMVTCTQRIHFPNLQYLHCDCIGRGFSFISQFKTSVNLKELSLRGSRFMPSCGMKLHVNWIPRTVQKLKLGDPIQVFGDTVFPMKQLVLENYSIKSVRRLITKIKPDLLVINNMWNASSDLDEIDNSLVPFLRQNLGLQNIYVGMFYWDAPIYNVEVFDSFECTVLSQIVDKKAQFYSFVNRVGHAITLNEFNKVACNK